MQWLFYDYRTTFLRRSVVNPMQGSNHEIGNEYKYRDSRSSQPEEDPETLSWPDDNDLLQVIHQKQHPWRSTRILRADRIQEALRQPAFAGLLADLQVYGERAQNEPFPCLTFELFRQFGRTGERKAYEQVYFDRRGRVAAVAMVALNTDSPHVLHALEEMLWTLCDEYTWCLPAHLGTGEAQQVEYNIDLFAAETVHMLAEVIALHGQRLDPLVVERVVMEAERRIFTPLYMEKRTYHWQTADHNWSAVCGGCCGMAAMLLLEEETILQESIKQTIRCMEAFLSGYGEDGGCAEGIRYWVYGFGYFIYYAEMLMDYSDGALNLLTDPKIAAIAAFPNRIHLSGGTYVNYSDSAECEEIPSGLLSRLAARFRLPVDIPLQVPRLTDDPCRRWAHMLRNIMWSDSAIYEHEHEQKAVQVNDGFIFHQLDWMVVKHALQMSEMSDACNEPDRLGSIREWVQAACSFKGGHNDEPHNHNDLGQVIIHCGGENILCDPGAGVYTQAYFSPEREQYLHISSSGHNVPLIEGYEQSSGREVKAKLLECTLELDGSEMRAALDLTCAYPKAASLHQYIRQMWWRIEKDGTRISRMNTCADGEVEMELAAFRVVDRFQWKLSTEANARKHCVDEPYVGPPCVVERWMSRTRPVLEKEGRLQCRATQANMYMIYDASLWRAETEAVHTVDHDQVAVTFYRTSLVWQGDDVEAFKRNECMSSGGDAVGFAGVQTGQKVEHEMLEIVCQVDFIIEPHYGRDRGEST